MPGLGVGMRYLVVFVVLVTLYIIFTTDDAESAVAGPTHGGRSRWETGAKTDDMGSPSPYEKVVKAETVEETAVKPREDDFLADEDEDGSDGELPLGTPITGSQTGVGTAKDETKTETTVVSPPKPVAAVPPVPAAAIPPTPVTPVVAAPPAAVKPVTVNPEKPVSPVAGTEPPAELPKTVDPEDPVVAKALKDSHVTEVGSSKLRSNFPLESLRKLYLDANRTDYRDIHALIRPIPNSHKKRVLVTGGAGFVGSHLVDRLMLMGHEVIVLDNLFTGAKRNIQHWLGHPHFEFVRHDVVDPFMAEVDLIYHLACPASPPHYQYNPVKTVKTSVMGSINMLGLAKRVKARYLLTSTSEVYGDPMEHPQVESYWGNVNPIGPRACYDEGKRVAETLSYSYHHQSGVDIRVARIFNTFGPRMNENDGRVVSNFILQALRGNDITVYGDGSQTRSFQYVHDLVDGLISLMEGNFTDPVNIGNPEEYTIQNFAQIIRDIVKKDVKIINLPATQDDPQKRRPDISRARKEIGWEPRFSMKQGVEETVEYFSTMIQHGVVE